MFLHKPKAICRKWSNRNSYLKNKDSFDRSWCSNSSNFIPFSWLNIAWFNIANLVLAINIYASQVYSQLSPGWEIDDFASFSDKKHCTLHPCRDYFSYLFLDHVHVGTILHSRVVWFSCFPCRKCGWYRCAIDPFKKIVASGFHSKPWFSTFPHEVCKISVFFFWFENGRSVSNFWHSSRAFLPVMRLLFIWRNVRRLRVQSSPVHKLGEKMILKRG